MKAACGRSDLLRALLVEGDAGLARMAALLGYERTTAVEEDARSPRRPIAPAVRAPAPRPEALDAPEAPPSERSVDVPFLIPIDFRPAKDEPPPPPPSPYEQLLRFEKLGLQTTPRPRLSPPLLRWPKTWQWLRRALARDDASRELDVERTIDLLSSGRALAQLPRRRRRGMVSRLVLVRDRSPDLIPFWPDQDELRRRLRARLGREAVDVVTLDEGPEGGATEPDVETTLWRSWPPAGTAVLALSDLGIYGGEEERLGWRRLAERLRRRGHRLRALVPASRRRFGNAAAAVWSAFAWDRASGCTGDAVADGTRRLLELLAPARLIEPALLRAARHLLSGESTDAGSEVEAWRAPGVFGGCSDAMGFSPELQGRLRASWCSSHDEAVKRAFVDLLRCHHAERCREVWWAEALWIGQVAPELLEPGELDAVRASFRALVERLGSGGDEVESAQVAAWYRAFAENADREYADERIGGILADAWVEFCSDESASPPPGLAAAKLRHARGEPFRRAVALCLHGDQIRFAPFDEVRGVVEDGRTSLLLPIGDAPRRLLVRNATGQRNVRLASREPAVTAPFDDFFVVTEQGEWRVTRITKPDWASAIGRDRFGLWAEFEVGAVMQRMRWIPPGPFWMGSPEDEPGRLGNEPLHREVVTRGFWLADTPCTQALWEAVIEENSSRFRSPLRPADQVSFEDVAVFVRRMRQLDERLFGMRLPFEHEWERACRAGTVGATYAGPLTIRGEYDGPELDPIAWYGGNSGVGFDLSEGVDSSDWPKKQHPHSQAGSREVGLRKANPFGLFDMLGNVYEWCMDRYRGDPRERDRDDGPEDRSSAEMMKENQGADRVLRGGSWNSLARFCRSASRDANEPSRRWGNAGFRLARGQGVRPEAEEPERRAGGKERAPEATAPPASQRRRAGAQEAPRERSEPASPPKKHRRRQEPRP